MLLVEMLWQMYMFSVDACKYRVNDGQWMRSSVGEGRSEVFSEQFLFIKT